MLKINIVYKNKNMPADILPPVVPDDRSYCVTWSREVQSGFDVVVYFNHYTYDRKVHQQVCPDALKFLYMYEPIAVDPVQYTRKIWKEFDARLTWNTHLAEASKAFIFEAGAYYDLPYCSDYGVQPLQELPDPADRKRAVVQVCGDKYSLSAEEIYSERRKVARWFVKKGKTMMDVFGRPAMQVPNYRGESADKATTLSEYRYALCFENTYHPEWTAGYLSEKILDCMACGTIPIYYGCSNIEKLVPEDCFLDYRKFQSLDELDERLLAMSDEEYLGYVSRMIKFHAGYEAEERHSVFRLYETVRDAVQNLDSQASEMLPEDYLQLSSVGGKIRFFLMSILLPYHKWVYGMFAFVRSFGRLKRQETTR